MADTVILERPRHDQADHGRRLHPRHGQSQDRTYGRGADPAIDRGGLHRREQLLPSHSLRGSLPRNVQAVS